MPAGVSGRAGAARAQRAVIMRGFEITGDTTVALDLSATSGSPSEQHEVTGLGHNNLATYDLDKDGWYGSM